MTNEQIIQNAISYLPLRNPRGVDVGDVALALNYDTNNLNQNIMMSFETGSGELVYLPRSRARYRPRYRRTNNTQTPVTDTETPLTGDPEDDYLQAETQVFNAYRHRNRQSRWIRAALFVLLVALVVKILK